MNQERKIVYETRNQIQVTLWIVGFCFFLIFLCGSTLFLSGFLILDNLKLTECTLQNKTADVTGCKDYGYSIAYYVNFTLDDHSYSNLKICGLQKQCEESGPESIGPNKCWQMLTNDLNSWHLYEIGKSYQCWVNSQNPDHVWFQSMEAKFQKFVIAGCTLAVVSLGFLFCTIFCLSSFCNKFCFTNQQERLLHEIRMNDA